MWILTCILNLNQSKRVVFSIHCPVLVCTCLKVYKDSSLIIKNWAENCKSKQKIGPSILWDECWANEAMHVRQGPPTSLEIAGPNFYDPKDHLAWKVGWLRHDHYAKPWKTQRKGSRGSVACISKHVKHDFKHDLYLGVLAGASGVRDWVYRNSQIL